MRILIDMDDVMADSTQQVLDFYKRDFGVTITKEQLSGKRLRQLVPEEHHHIAYQYHHEKGFFERLQVIENSQEVIKELYDKHDVYIVSAAMEFPHSFTEKFLWLDKHFSFIPWNKRIFCGDKSVIDADVMIDDNDFNLAPFRGRKLMFTAPHNALYERYERVNSWEEVRQKLL